MVKYVLFELKILQLNPGLANTIPKKHMSTMDNRTQMGYYIEGPTLE